ncbi:spore germination protein GerM [Bacillus inaquosorum]|uniref:spore germination protein GerM n=1 Tax=Bacillus inaquosorum TaxID=483913 RepID=UPI00227FF87E|nr:spore germination protein GerM [Bacillus inaquosorum]MCY8145444.1 spore germination protein GerM [Bacillus inaquosorum]MCY8752379.1 spore germination protein GerM [Bacillus inaquosorum]MCY8795639.1 spore germination protein GerM [Bacillus inaquosorum]MEC0575735.1 spore germination protein GerM [Bacillus inaquosorum]MEC0772717.1 spore germination protein GerM [Bacillus inaquosorum]
MLKKGPAVIGATCLTSVLLLSGCGLFQSDKAAEEIDPPQDVTYVNDEAGADSNTTAAEKTESEKSDTAKADQASSAVMRELYLIDKNGYVVAQTLPLPKSEGTAKQALEYLVQGGPVSEILPNGFRAVLPADTTVNVDIKKDGTAIADFSNEFKNYKKEDEQKIVQSVTWTLTQFSSIDKVKLRINGHELREMPVGGTPISDDLSRKDGINLETAGVNDLTATHPLTVYYLAENDDSEYYVPVTKRIDNSEKDDITAAINELAKGPSKVSGLLTDFSEDVKLVSKPKIKDGRVTLDFNQSIFGSADEKTKMISSEVLNSIVLTLTEQPDVKSVSVKVNGKSELVNEKGEKLTEPVSRPSQVNTGSF